MPRLLKRKPSGRVGSVGTVASAATITHEHLLGIVVTEGKRLVRARPLRILDAGCGDGALLSYLQSNLGRVDPDLKPELWGFDVNDDEIQRPGFLDSAIERLEADFPTIDWHRRIFLIGTADSWPFEDDYFDIIISNQVLEHVAHIDAFLGEVFRLLKIGGVSAHLFPLKECVLEGHLSIPLIHRILSHDLRVDIVRWFSHLGIGKLGPTLHKDSELERFSVRHSDYIQFLTHYRTWSEIAHAAKVSGLRSTYRYTPELYLRKLARVLGASYPFVYRAEGRSLYDALSFLFLKRIASITVLFEKEQTYKRSPHRSSLSA
jgi:ubiquinone/menaquinone biosynthesis C-methylase UbiE